MSKLAIGCPVFEREWILPSWFNCLYNQSGINTQEIDLVFAYTEGNDRTLEFIISQEENFNAVYVLACNDLPAYGDRNRDRFYPLVELRNRILDTLIEIGADLYFSWDSDILIPENCIEELLKRDKDIVAPWVDLTPPRGIPNCASRVKGTDIFKRYHPIEEHYPPNAFYQVDTVFAIFLMQRKVFEICRYSWHVGGEDYGWAIDVEDKGFESWMDSNIVCTHIFHKVKV